MTWGTVWLCVGLLILVVEAIGLANGGPATKYVRALQRTTAYRCLALMVWLWLTWHWFLEWRSAPQWMATRIDDAVVVLIGFLLGLIRVREPRPVA